MLHLVLNIPDQPDFTAATTAAWVLLDANGSGNAARAASSPLKDAPRDTPTTVLLPASRVVFIDTPLPRVSASKREELVRFAIEDKLTIDPATIHAVIVGESRQGSATTYHVAAIDRQWFSSVLTWLQAAQIVPGRVLIETDLVAVSAGEWTVALGRDYGYAKRDDGFVTTLDGGVSVAPPFGLVLALREARDSQRAPRALTLTARDAETVISADTARAWSEALQCTVRIQPASAALRVPPATAVNLLHGAFAPISGTSAWARRLKPALVVLALIAASHLGFGLFEWMQLARKKENLTAEMTQLFKTSFPDALNITDPALQMERNVESLKRERGAAAPDPLRAALAEFAALRDQVPSLRVRAVELSAERAMLQGTVADSAAQAELSRAVAAIPQAMLAFDPATTTSATAPAFTLTAKARP